MLIELSIFTSILAITLSFFFYEARIGLENSMLWDVVKALGLSLLLLNVPHHITRKNKSTGEEVCWYTSQAFTTLVILSIIIFIGFIIQNNSYYVDSLLSAIGYSAFAGTLFKYAGTSGKKIIHLLFVCMYLAFSLWAVAAIWGSGYQVFSYYKMYFNPLFVESIPLGWAHSDTFFHSSIASMIQTYGIPSTGLDGLPYIHYHIGSHWIFAQLAKLQQISIINFYQLYYPILFLPLFFHSFLLFTIEVRARYFPHEGLKKPLFGFCTFVLFAAGYIQCLPGKIPALATISEPVFLSSSYLVSATLAFLLFCLLINFRKISTADQFSRTDMLLLFFIMPCMLGCIGLAKISVLFLICVLLSYLFIRLGLFKNKVYILSYLAAASVAFAVLAFTYPASSESHTLRFFDQLEKISLPDMPLYFLLNYFWSFAAIFLMIKILTKTNSASLYNAIKSRKTLGCEIVIIVCIAGFLPGNLSAIQGGDANYFSGFQKLVSLSLLLALLRTSLKSRTVTVLLLLLCLPLAYMVYDKASAKFTVYHSRMNTLKNTIMARESSTYECLKILQNLNQMPLSQKKDTVLFIPQNNSGYWNMIDNLNNCQHSAFLAPALTGMAMIDGMPAASCDDKYKFILGYASYTLRTIEQTEQDREDTSICAKAAEKGFKTIIRIDQTEEGFKQTVIDCKN
jgi:hypothetical protein